MTRNLPKNKDFKPGKKVAIIGGGFLGLALAYYLSKDGTETVLIEKSNDLGGLAGGFTINDSALEKYYHHLFKSDASIQALLGELGMLEELQWIPAKMGIYLQGKLYSFRGPLDLMRFAPLPFFSRIRAGLVSLYLQKIAKPESFAGITALNWCNKNFGKRVTAAIWEPLLKSKFGDKYNKIAMVWLWSRLHDRGSSRPGIFKDEELGYVKGSLQTLIDKLETTLIKQKVRIYKNAGMLDFQDGGRIHKLIWRDSQGKIQQEPFSHIVATIPPRQFLEVFNAPQPYIKAWDKIEFIGAVCMTLVLKHSIQPYYWTSVNDPKEPFVALVEHTNLVGTEQFHGDHIIYLGKYLKTSEAMFTMNEQELKALACEFLRKVNPDFTPDWIKNSYIFKAPEAQHIVTTDYQAPQYASGIKNVFLAHFAQIYPQDRGTNNAVKQALELFKIIKRSN